MNAGLLRKAIRESWAIIVFVAMGLFTIQIFFGRILPAFYGDVTNNLLALPFVRKVVAAAVGLEVSAEIGPATMVAMVWAHPVVLTLVWVLAIWAGTRVPAGEVDRGTIDVLLSWPVSRRQVFAAELVVAAVAGLAVVTMAFAGNAIGGWSMETSVVGTPGRRLWVAVNLWALYFVGFGASSLASSLSERRGRAAGLVVGFVIGSFVLSFLSAFSEPIRRVSFLSVLNYYRPLFILQDGVVPWRDIFVLAIAGLICWGVACVVFVRRDVRTV